MRAARWIVACLAVMTFVLLAGCSQEPQEPMVAAAGMKMAVLNAKGMH